MDKNQPASWLGWASLAIMAVYAAFWALFGAGEILAGNWSGIVYFIPVILILGLMFLCWKRPMIGGILSLLAGSALAVRFYTSMERPADQVSAAVVIGGPFVLAGMLLILYAVVIQPRRSDENANP